MCYNVVARRRWINSFSFFLSSFFFSYNLHGIPAAVLGFRSGYILFSTIQILYLRSVQKDWILQRSLQIHIHSCWFQLHSQIIRLLSILLHIYFEFYSFSPCHFYHSQPANYEIYYLSADNYDPATIDLIFIRVKIYPGQGRGAYS